METLLRPVIISTSSRPAATASSTTYWMAGLSTTGSISLGVALVAGRNLVPRPAAGITALVTSLVVAAGSALPEHQRTSRGVPGGRTGTHASHVPPRTGPLRAHALAPPPPPP